MLLKHMIQGGVKAPLCIRSAAILAFKCFDRPDVLRGFKGTKVVALLIANGKVADVQELTHGLEPKL